MTLSKKIQTIAAALVLTTTFYGCTYLFGTDSDRRMMLAEGQKSSSCPPAGSVENLDKVMNAQFGDNYVGCSVRVKASFMAMNNGPFAGRTCNDLSAHGKMAFYSQTSAGQYFVFVDNSLSDKMFSLKGGDQIELTGGTMADSYPPFVFVATDVTRSRGNSVKDQHIVKTCDVSPSGSGFPGRF